MLVNFQRGFQRVYAVLTLVWIAGVSFAVFSGRSEPPWLEGWAVVRTVAVSGFNSILSGWSPAVWLWAIGLSLIPPAVLYSVLFCISPWIYRGFKSAK